MKMTNKLLFCKTFNNGIGWKTVNLSEEEEDKIRTLHDIETIRIFRACLEDAQHLSDSPERCFRIAIALFHKRCDKIFTWIQRALDAKAQAET